MSKISNTLLMLFYLNNKTTFTKISELANYLEVSDREVRRYRDDLEMAGFAIENKMGRYGGYRLISNVILTMNIKHIKHVMLGLGDSHHLIDVQEQIIIELIRYLKSDQYISEHLLDERLIDVLLKINLSIHLRKKLDIEYQSSKGHMVHHLIEPYILKTIRNEIYLFALNQGILKSYRVSHILSMGQTDLGFVVNKEIYDKEKHELAYGVYRTNQKHVIDFIVYGKMKEFVSNIFDYKVECIETNDGYGVYRLQTYMLQETLPQFLSLGKSLKIIAPQAFKDVYLKEIDEMKNKI